MVVSEGDRDGNLTYIAARKLGCAITENSKLGGLENEISIPVQEVRFWIVKAAEQKYISDLEKVKRV